MSAQANTDEKKPLDMKQVTKILKTPSESRTLKQCTELQEIIGDLQFFKEYNANPSTQNVPKLCCKYMDFEKFEENDIIFELGSIGNKFYIILEGNVGVFIKKPPSMIQQQQEEKKKDENEIVDKLQDFMNVKELGDGSAFGELALLNNKPRLATIKCLKETYVATLSKENFNRILKEHEEQKLNKEIQFFERVPAFKDFTQKQIRYLCLNNKIIETKKNEVIFDEKDPCDCLFVIKEGEFEIYKQVVKQVDHKEELMKQNILSMSALNKNNSQKVTKYIKIKVLSIGETVGEEFFLKKKKREFKLVCSSFNGVIVKIKANDFLRKISEDPVVQNAFFKRFKAIHQENEERVQKRIEQFHEFKNYLVQDSLPTKIKMSIDKLYQNNSMSSQQKENGIKEFRQQIIDMENLERKSQLQQAILSNSTLSQRFTQANSTMFQNQVQYLKYKRLSVLADATSPSQAIGREKSATLNQDFLQNDNRRSSFSNATAALQEQSNHRYSLSKDQVDYISQIPSNRFNSNKSLLDVGENGEKKNTLLNTIKEKVSDLPKSLVNKSNLEGKNQVKRGSIFKNHQNSSENLQTQNNNNQMNSNLYQLAPQNLNAQQKLEALSEDKQSANCASPIIFNNTSKLQRNLSFNNNSSSFYSGQRLKTNEQNYGDYESSPKVTLIKNRSAVLSQPQSSNKVRNEMLEYQKPSNDSENLTNKVELYQFNIPKKRLAKLTNVNLKQDNFIRDWKKSQNVQEDAQQKSIVKKIKKITSQNNKFSDYFIQQNGNNQTEQNNTSNNSQLITNIYPMHIGSKSENVSLNNSPQTFVLPKIIDYSPSTNQNSNNINSNVIGNLSIISLSCDGDSKKIGSPQVTKPLQMKSIFINKDSKLEKKRQTLVIN